MNISMRPSSATAEAAAQSPTLSLSPSAGVLLALALASAPACHDSSHGGGGTLSSSTTASWNSTAIDASGTDHTAGFGEHPGPCRAARAMAIVHIAVFEAVNAIEGDFQTYVGLPAAPAGTSRDAAVAQAAHDTLVGLYTLQAATFDAKLAAELALIPDGAAKTQGIALGQAAAAAILGMRTNDGSEDPEMQLTFDYVPGNGAGEWRQDPISMHPLALGAMWPGVDPFVMTSADQFQCPPPPDLTSLEYAAAYNEAKVLGGDGVTTPTIRTEEQTFIGIFWAYDGLPSLCAPPRLYNQIAVQIAEQQGTTEVELARLLVLLNVAMADGGLAAWETKYFYKFWRPVGGVREADLGTGPSGSGDNNPATLGDIMFTPLGAPASNTTDPNFTPPFPAYPSGHAVFGGVLFQTLRNFYGTDDIAFTFVSDEFNGVTTDNQGNVRPLMPRSFNNLTEPEEENGQSRIYLGIHWNFDKTEGIAQGNTVADFVFANIYQPVP